MSNNDRNNNNIDENKEVFRWTRMVGEELVSDIEVDEKKNDRSVGDINININNTNNIHGGYVPYDRGSYMNSYIDYMIIPPSRNVMNNITDYGLENMISIFDIFNSMLVGDVPQYNRIETMEDRMMEIAMRESLLHYKTQEKKPNIKLAIKSMICDDKYKGENCAICKCEFENDVNITILKCKHILHTECISEWVKYKAECPVCRDKIKIIDTSLDEEKEKADI